ncbi:dephospho-CoA kinase [Encephalitozoon cuniculi EcunIII-L]|uniref:Dephospho-CoA kinase n=1 Tax=Encephalitozoon cuniculi TaxID=6035 RepID=M1K7J4_ENCCN|nr:hypothetical protein ECU11_0300 [Encephalitozoon cuniculi]KMV64985.1 dephospho-CoA kinase [Encephalitozoon cuniculi EcunIII-L]UYI26227.1 dephospho-CoA kinase [Encephalitozoon cuniculi]
MRIVAITGSTGTGKTALLNLLEAKGYATINSDSVVREILKGSDIEGIRRRFFTDPKFRAAHERRVRPRIYIEIAKKIAYLLLMGHPVIFIEIPLLFELNLHHYFYTIVVTCDERLQIKRGGKIDYLEQRLALQLPIAKKIELAQKVIYNNGSINDLMDEVDRIDICGSNIYYCLLIMSIIVLLITCE